MKFALALLALVAAADSEAPVISLNLGNEMNKRRTAGKSTSNSVSHPKLHDATSTNSFADECEVNSACKEPEASAYDHHDGDISASIKTTYKLFVASRKHKTPVKVDDDTKKSIDLSVRGEWVISYDVKDDAGNEAEKVQFALILIDTVAPTFDNSPGTKDAMTVGCKSHDACVGHNYRRYWKNDAEKPRVDLELCGNLGNLKWSEALTATDNYDGSLTESNSVLLKDVAYVIPKETYKNLDHTSNHNINYKISSADFADIFGSNNQNNVVTENGIIRLRDTIKPTIILPGAGQSWECGYTVGTGKYRPGALYQDCYDDWTKREYKKAKNAVRVQVTSTHHKNRVDMDTNKDQILGVAGAHSKVQTITLYYNVKDHFNLAADEATQTFDIVDTIAPTLYITQGKKTNNQDCQGWNAKSTNAAGDLTQAHCKIETKDGHFQYQHSGKQAHHEATDPMTREVVIQHSAGYASDYKFVVELMKEGTGFTCFDRCSETTTTVEWTKTCDDHAEGTQFDMLVPGTYYLKYTCKDQAVTGRPALQTTACRTFINLDKTKPIITILEAANDKYNHWHIEASRDNNYVDAGATCSDMVDGNISQDVEVSGDVVNMAAVGTYKINYNCEDSAGQKALQATRTVIVEDTTCPTCTVPGNEETITVEASFPYTEEASTCTDTLDGAMPNAGIYGQVNVELTGTYVLTYSATDKNGNGQTGKCGKAHFMKTVVVEDTMVPIISLKYKGNKLMAESTSTVNGWVIGAVASAVSGVALLGYAATRKTAVATSVPV